MSRICAALVLCIMGAPLWADARITVLMDVMQIDDVIDILYQEGLEHGETLNRSLLDGQGGDVWAQQVRDIYDPQRIETGLRTALSDGLEPDEIESATAFYASDAGTDIVASENRARRLMSDAGIPTAARELVAQTQQENPALYSMVENYIRVNSLIENNVAASMSQQHRFLLGLSDGGYNERREADILDEVWQMRDPLTAETRDWLFGYLVLAYIGLPQDDLDAYLDFSRSEAGQALNSALFDGFGAVFRDVSYGLGRAVALNASRDEL